MNASEQDGLIDEEDRALLQEVLDALDQGPALPERTSFRASHASARTRLDGLERSGLLGFGGGRYRITLAGLLALRSPRAKIAYERCLDVLGDLRIAYLDAQGKPWTTETFGTRFQRSTEEAARALTLLTDIPGLSCHGRASDTGLVSLFALDEPILDAVIPEWPDEGRALEDTDFTPCIETIEISGYRPFAGFSASVGNLTVIIGANASGKSSLFDALRLLAYAVENPLPLEIDPRHTSGAMLFHAGGPEQIDLAVTVPFAHDHHLRFEVSIQGPLGAPRVARERLATTEPLGRGAGSPFVFLDFRNGKGEIRHPDAPTRARAEWAAPPNELALRRTLDPTLVVHSRFRAFVASWRSYTGFDVGPQAAMRQPAYIDENPVLAEDGSNLSAVLHSLVLVPEHRAAWEELEMHLRAVVPGFESLGVRPRGVRGMAIGTWRELGVEDELALGDLSEGTLRLLCWLALAFSPNLPPVVLIDEPELGLHPRVLPMLAGAFKLASARSQILITTHSPHFLSQFALDEIAVMRKDDGHAVFLRPGTSDALRHEVEELGGEALARLFLSEELEVLP